MRKIISIIALLCCMTLCFGAIAENMSVKANSQQKQAAQPMSFSAQTSIEQANAPANAAASASPPIPKDALSILKRDSGKNYSEMNLTLYSAVQEFGMEGLGVGEVVRFEAPKPGWKLKGIEILGWSGFNNTTKLFPADRTFLVEVRDKNADLLYKFIDIQNIYYASTKGPVAHDFAIPVLSVTGDFYVIFYDRGSMGLGMELDNETGNSYFLINGQLSPAEFKMKKTNETLRVNWLIRAIGE